MQQRRGDGSKVKANLGRRGGVAHAAERAQPGSRLRKGNALHVPKARHVHHDTGIADALMHELHRVGTTRVEVGAAFISAAGQVSCSTCNSRGEAIRPCIRKRDHRVCSRVDCCATWRTAATMFG